MNEPQSTQPGQPLVTSTLHSAIGYSLATTYVRTCPLDMDMVIQRTDSRLCHEVRSSGEYGISRYKPLRKRGRFGNFGSVRQAESVLVSG